MTEAIEKVGPLELRKHAEKIAAATKSESTKKAYRSDIKQFHSWADLENRDIDPCSEEVLNEYIIYLSKIGRKPTTIQRKMTAINQWHVLQGYESPVKSRVRETNKGIRRLQGVRRRRVRPLTWKALDRLLEFVPGHAIGIRDKALLLLGFAGAFRRSELVAIDIEDLEFCDEGLVVSQSHSKTNQEGEIRQISIPFVDVKDRCPVKAVRRLVEYNQQSSGPLFFGLGSAGRRMLDVPLRRRLRAPAVALIIKRYAALAGYNPKEYAGHSLRSGFATSASQAGVRSMAIMGQTGHKSHSVLMTYVRDGRKFQGHPLLSIVSFCSSEESN